MRRIATSLLFAALVMVGAKPANAATILVFGQQGLNVTMGGIENGDGSTTIYGQDVLTNLTAFFGTGGAVSNVYFNFLATSTSPAVNTTGTISQHYSGTFSFTSLAGGGGINYLSGSFADLLSGGNGNSAFGISSTTPGDIVSFSSDYGALLPELGISLSFITVSPALAIVNAGGDTVRAFSAAISGNFQADQVTSNVPEPASLLLFGTGLLGLGAAYRRRQQSRKA